LFDILWEVYRETGSKEPIHVVSAYRSPETNAMLRRRSKAVSEHSQHMAGKAMDIRLPDVETARLRAIAMKLQYGGVGYYASSAFVHVDTGSVRAWPRMSEQQLVRLFPDGKTLHLPPSGKPLARYEEARLEVGARKAALGSAGFGPSLGSIFAGLFRTDEPPAATAAAPARTAKPSAPAPGRITVASADDSLPQMPQAPSQPLPPEALAFAPLPPLPPRRPADGPAAPAAVQSQRVEVASLGGDFLPVLAEPSPPAPAEPASPASRLLFSAVPLDASPRPRPAAEGTRVAAEIIVADAGAPALDLRFSPRPQRDLGIGRFDGPAVRPLPVLRQARVDL
jgi:hypothetical protein